MTATGAMITQNPEIYHSSHMLDRPLALYSCEKVREKETQFEGMELPRTGIQSMLMVGLRENLLSGGPNRGFNIRVCFSENETQLDQKDDRRCCRELRSILN